METITEDQIKATPIWRQAEQQAREAAQAKARAEAAEQQRREAQAAREADIAKIKNDIEHDLAIYQAHRLAIRKALARLHEHELQYKSTLGIASINSAPVVPVQLKKAHLPTAFPRPSDALYPLFSTAEEDAATFAATRRWGADIGDPYQE